MLCGLGTLLMVQLLTKMSHDNIWDHSVCLPITVLCMQNSEYSHGVPYHACMQLNNMSGVFTR